MAVRRSDLYLPANNEHMILKAPTLGADVITLDMEDPFPPQKKKLPARWSKSTSRR